MRYSLLFTILFLVLAMSNTTPASAQEATEKRTITVSGEGRVTVEPDVATVRFGIVTQAKDAEEAREQNAQASAEAMNAVRELDVPERKIKLESLRLTPAREYDRETRKYIEIGFEVSRRLVVEVEDLDQLPALIAHVVQKGANRLEGISYNLKDRESVRNDALREAVLNARKKAELMANALGSEVGEALRVNEQGIHIPGPLRTELSMSDAPMLKAAAAAPEPEAYAAGEMEVRANVGITFVLR